MKVLKQKYSVYILKSLKNGTHYVGLSQNVHERLKQHDCGKVRSTKSHRPYEIVLTEYVGSLTEARKREKYYKSTAGRRLMKEKYN